MNRIKHLLIGLVKWTVGAICTALTLCVAMMVLIGFAIFPSFDMLEKLGLIVCLAWVCASGALVMISADGLV